MLQSMSAKAEPLIFVARRSLRNNGQSPSNLELYDLMYLVSCTQAAKKWKPDWAFCPVCMQQVSEFGEVMHFKRVHA